MARTFTLVSWLEANARKLALQNLCGEFDFPDSNASFPFLLLGLSCSFSCVCRRPPEEEADPDALAAAPMASVNPVDTTNS